MSLKKTRFFETKGGILIMNKPKLIIWDYDGVLADSEELWIKVWQNLINERFGLSWDFQTANHYCGGLAPKTKIANLAKIGLMIDDDFLNEIKVRERFDIENNMQAMLGVEDILQNSPFKYCLATGGNLDKTEAKLAAMNFKQYFLDTHIFTAQQVEHGKPAPDLFIFAAEKMGFKPQDCLVIEDSLPGLKAALAAKMHPIAFLGGKMNNHPAYHQEVKKLGVKDIFYEMKDLNDYLLNIDK